jgi:hemoglobin/transferrin/lactoferrin receptor protein
LQISKSLAMSEYWTQKITYGLDFEPRSPVGSGVGPVGTHVPKSIFPTPVTAALPSTRKASFLTNAGRDARIRVERYAVDVISQAGYAPPATTPGVSIDGVNTSPKLGVLFRASPQISLYSNYSSGFRAPSAAQLNGFIDPSPGVNARLLPNPDLKPETSKNIELGLRPGMQACAGRCRVHR